MHKNIEKRFVVFVFLWAALLLSGSLLHGQQDIQKINTAIKEKGAKWGWMPMR
jgi:hypothetical protein